MRPGAYQLPIVALTHTAAIRFFNLCMCSSSGTPVKGRVRKGPAFLVAISIKSTRYSAPTLKKSQEHTTLTSFAPFCYCF